MEWTKIEPDMVFFFGTLAQIMRLVQAATYHTGGHVSAICAGKVACNTYIVQPMRTGEPHIALPGNGDRVWAATQDDELLFAMPAARLEQIIEGLEAQHKGGIRYPVPADIRYKPIVPPLYERLVQAIRRI